MTCVKALCTYTVNVCKNEKHFPKRNRWILTQPIVTEALAAMSCIRHANAVRVVEREDYIYRYSEQQKAYAHLEALLSLIEIAYGVLGVEVKAIEYWTGLVLQTEEKLQAWKKSDRERYKTIRVGSAS